MSTCAFVAPPTGLAPVDYRKNIQNQILACDPAIVLACKDYVVFYSGPSIAVINELGHVSYNNNDRSAILAHALNASRINDTLAALFLGTQKLWDYFDGYAKAKHSDPDLQAQEKNKAYATVWGGPSELLANRGFKKAATVVCGADHNRVFVIDEMVPLIMNPSCGIINDIPVIAHRRMLTEVCKDAAFDLLCRSELKLVQGLAVNDIVNFAWWSQDFADRVSFYVEERKDTDPLPLTANQASKKNDIIKDFKLAALYATHPSSWRCVAPPAASLPKKPPILTMASQCVLH